MIMATTRTRVSCLAAVLALVLCGVAATAQDPPAPKDDALDSLLKKVEEKDNKAAGKAEPSPPAGEKDAKDPAKAKPGSPSGGKPGSDVSGKDKALDSLLEKYGATEDKPAPEERRPSPGGAGEPKPGEKPSPDKPGQEKKGGEALSGKSRQLDEHLEELTGKRRKKNRRDEEENGPLSEVIKEMREVEQRLGKPDTGEETRQKQVQIVKRLQTLIEQARSQSSQSRSRQRRTMAMKPGEQPGPQDQPGNNSGQAPFAKPQKPPTRHSLAGGRDEWGHLPPELRQEMDNVFKEDPLPAHEELIRRYYLSLTQKKLSRGR
jgi:hypothetical protein